MKRLCPLYCGLWQPQEYDAAIGGLAKGDIVVLNGESSGPPAVFQPWLRDMIERFHARSIACVGYQHVEWLRRPSAQCLAEGAVWLSYGVDGIFRDEAPLVDGNGALAYLRALHGQARAVRADIRTGYRRGISVFNPGGGPVPPIWYRMLPGSIWCTWEGPGSDYHPGLPSAYPLRESHLIYAATEVVIPDPQIGYAYVTQDGFDGNPWDSFSRLVTS